jgi:hypothetical protein
VDAVQAIDVPPGSDAQTGAPSRTMCWILYPRNLDDEVTDLLDAVGVPGFTRTDKVLGRGPRGHHFDNHVWPGADGMIYTVVDPRQIHTLTSALAALSRALEARSNGLYGLHVFTWPCEQLI